MKIIAGKWGGQSVLGKPSPKMRPTSDKVREAIFDQLEARWISSWEDMSVLDLFAGTGGFGLEALSRGASRAVFVDHHLPSIQNLKKSYAQFIDVELKAEGADRKALESRAEALCKGAIDAIRWLDRKGERFDLIFLDPPYREDWVLATLTVLQNHPLLKRKGLIIAEHDKREPMTAVEGFWKQEGGRRYGDTAVTFFSYAS